MNIHTDEHINYWSEIYVGNPRIRTAGYCLATFLDDPQGIMARVGLIAGLEKESDTEEYLDLLPAQMAVQARIAQAERRAS